MKFRYIGLMLLVQQQCIIASETQTVTSSGIRVTVSPGITTVRERIDGANSLSVIKGWQHEVAAAQQDAAKKARVVKEEQDETCAAQYGLVVKRDDLGELSHHVATFEARPEDCYYQRLLPFMSDKTRGNLFGIVKAQAALLRAEKTGQLEAVKYWQKELAPEKFDEVAQKIKDDYNAEQAKILTDMTRLREIIEKQCKVLSLISQDVHNFAIVAQLLSDRREAINVLAWQQLVGKKLDRNEFCFQHATTYVDKLVTKVRDGVALQEERRLAQEAEVEKQAAIEAQEQERRRVQAAIEKEKLEAKIAADLEKKRLENAKKRAKIKGKKAAAQAREKAAEEMCLADQRRDVEEWQIVRKQSAVNQALQKMKFGSDIMAVAGGAKAKTLTFTESSRKENELLMLATAKKRREKFEEFLQQTQDSRKLSQLMKQYDTKANASLDEYEKSEQMVYRFRDLLSLKSTYNPDLYQYLYDTAVDLDSLLQEQGMSISVYFENEDFIQSQITARLAALKEELVGVDVQEVKRSYCASNEKELEMMKKLVGLKADEAVKADVIRQRIELKHKSNKNKKQRDAAAQSELSLALQEDAALIALRVRIGITENIIASVQAETQRFSDLVNKFIAQEQLSLIQDLITSQSDDHDVDASQKASGSISLHTSGSAVSSEVDDFVIVPSPERMFVSERAPGIESVGSNLTVKDVAKNRTQIRGVMNTSYIIDTSLKLPTVRVLFEDFMSSIEVEEDSADLIEQMSSATMSMIQSLEHKDITPQFKQNLFESVLGECREADQMRIVADIVRFQVMVIEAGIGHKKA